jgi:hypothetical protein
MLLEVGGVGHWREKLREKFILAQFDAHFHDEELDWVCYIEFGGRRARRRRKVHAGKQETRKVG